MSRAISSRPMAWAGALSVALALTACGTGSDGAAAQPESTTIAGATVTRDHALHDGLPASIKSAGAVRVATDVPYPPFEMFDGADSQRITGLDYDLGQALATKLGVRFDFTATKFDSIVPSVQAGKFDVVMSAMTDTKDRQQVLDFVDYSASGSGILVAKGNPEHIATLTDLCGRAVAVQSGTKQAKLLQDQSPCKQAGKPEPQLLVFPKDADAQLAIKSGKAVADFMDQPAAGYLAATAENGAEFEVVADPAYPNGVDATPNGIGVAKNQKGLADSIQRALQALMDDGSYHKILDHYGQRGIAIMKATINAAVN
ncbi:ABC transporter substrate-binding protein [Nocardia yunnanensis]|uniref:ABC transporter substrate-binding protein n=1 Tax=Nocardia yunnanensis TaxID=2382165 RepID=A0A386ZFI2_9NOCA|nr:ABC transporter substrate-binding protein [Nocardia yunnanensis]AYF75385.1 ABC transporter substrate-binding protein [Nocardia yunnanensis]